MTSIDLIQHLVQGERWFNNGSKRSREVTRFDGIFVYYLSNNGRNTTGIFTERFAKWAKSTGKI
ncbi:hypothetical protein PaeCFBP13512_22400 [Paenibacillus sp. CFBP13512]|uniref:hypothetical protein n=1 Tax=Paenibacillus sp. CFBP13512 TaxID=2184007 RepID=UPI0010C11BB0|nr:hypothetical protein [Paenibacillus sp. CFBP13512]TKJ83770.1 hypothetical protein PaeCFBP13512_22400 [Paenibacillus sp. CFBP13512]